jgi:RNA polymerase sigma factor (sigma-70 family)
MDPDSELTVRLVEGNTEAALAELVRRYVNLVYSAALRQVGGDTHFAEDVVQIVFARFVCQAASLRNRASLGGWFYTTTHHVAANVVRSERRRKHRDKEAQVMENIKSTAEPGADWSLLQPVLDHAMHEINQKDRDAIRLRYFERLPVAEVGLRLGVTENAAAKRIERALEKLRARFTRRGITSTSIALAAVLEGQASVATPAGLAASVTAVALSGAAVGASGTGLGVFTFMSTAKITVGLVSLAVSLAIGAALIKANARDAQSALAMSMRRHASSNAKLVDMENQLQAATNRMQVAEKENQMLLATVQAMQATDAAQASVDAQPITDDMVLVRFNQARELVRSGDGETALRELLWCYNVGFPHINSGNLARVTSLGLFGELGERYPPALEALRELRDQAQPRVQASENDYDATLELAAINHALKDDQANLAILDKFPQGDRRRKTLAFASADYLVANQRYDIAAEGWPYGVISAGLERRLQSLQDLPLPTATPNPEEARRVFRESTLAWAATNIEMLAGAGDLAHARSLAERLLAFDSSESTRALIQQHAERAGHPTLLASPTTP